MNWYDFNDKESTELARASSSTERIGPFHPVSSHSHLSSASRGGDSPDSGPRTQSVTASQSLLQLILIWHSNSHLPRSSISALPPSLVDWPSASNDGAFTVSRQFFGSGDETELDTFFNAIEGLQAHGESTLISVPAVESVADTVISRYQMHKGPAMLPDWTRYMHSTC
jgi:hypothetical protein